MFNIESPPGIRSVALLSLLLLRSLASAATLDSRDPVPAGYASPPYYPAPYGGWDDEWGDAYEKAVALVSRMTVAEKVNITAGTGMYMVRAPRFSLFLEPSFSFSFFLGGPRCSLSLSSVFFSLLRE